MEAKHLADRAEAGRELEELKKLIDNRERKRIINVLTPACKEALAYISTVPGGSLKKRRVAEAGLLGWFASCTDYIVSTAFSSKTKKPTDEQATAEAQDCLQFVANSLTLGHETKAGQDAIRHMDLIRSAYSPRQLAAKIDIEGTLNLSCIDSLHGGEKEKVKQSQHEDDERYDCDMEMNKSAWHIKKYNRVLEMAATDLCGGQLTEDNVCSSMDPELMIRALIKNRFAGWDCNRLITICVATDGTRKGKQHFTFAGFKFSHCGLEEPLSDSKARSMKYKSDQYKDISSRLNCHACVSVISNDHKETLEKYIAPFYEFCMRLHHEGLVVTDDNGQTKTWRFNVIGSNDMKTVDEQANCGGCSQTSLCYSCCGGSIKHDQCSKHDACASCVRKGTNITKCRHHARYIANAPRIHAAPEWFYVDWSSTPISKCKVEPLRRYTTGVLEALIELGVPHVLNGNDYLKNGLLKQETCVSVINNFLNDWPLVIHGESDNGANACVDFCHDNTITGHLALRFGAQATAGLMPSEKRSRLKDCLIREKYHSYYTARTEAARGAMWTDSNAQVPCWLHCEWRVMQKMIVQLVQMNVLDRKLSKEQKEERILLLEGCMGDIIRPRAVDKTVVKISIEAKTETVTNIDVSNQKILKILKEFKKLMGVIYPENERYVRDGSEDKVIKAMIDNWTDLIEKWLAVTVEVKVTADFSDSSIETVQDKMDTFGEQFLKVLGPHHVGNYVHYIIAGHFREYLYLHRNIYKFANQDWEAYNGYLKNYAARHTQGGGACGRGGQVEPLSKAFLRINQRNFMYYLDNDISLKEPDASIADGSMVGFINIEIAKFTPLYDAWDKAHRLNNKALKKMRDEALRDVGVNPRCKV
jgi:hypothetical protein